MHDGELTIDEDTARRLIDEQFPQWRPLPIHPVPGAGTVNAIYRVGEAYAARFPLVGEDGESLAASLSHEASALAEFADACPFPAPEPVALGAPGAGYPLAWSVQTWVPGTVATPDAVARSSEFADDLVRLIRALRAADTRGRGFSGTGRGGDLLDSDEWMETCFAESAKMLPVDALRAVWREMRMLPDPQTLVMTHGDLTPANLIVDHGRLAGVLDGGGFGPADPSLDLVAAWHLLDAETRAALREGLGSDDLEWSRGRAWAFQQAMGLVWYYQESNATMSALGRSTLRRILDDENSQV